MIGIIFSVLIFLNLTATPLMMANPDAKPENQEAYLKAIEQEYQRFLQTKDPQELKNAINNEYKKTWGQEIGDFFKTNLTVILITAAITILSNPTTRKLWEEEHKNNQLQLELTDEKAKNIQLSKDLEYLKKVKQMWKTEADRLKTELDGIPQPIMVNPSASNILFAFENRNTD